MSSHPATGQGARADAQWFTTTHWSVVLAAGHSTAPGAHQALDSLCRTYWPPLYAYVRRQGCGPEEAQDLTQEFFARFLAKKYFGHADQAQGKFRTFLLTSLRHFLVSEWRKTASQKRGDGCVAFSLDAQAAEAGYAAEPADEATPETLYEKRWAVTLMEHVMARLGEEHVVAGNGPLFEKLKDCIWGESGAAAYAAMAARLGLSEGAVKVSVHRLRQRCRELLRAEVAQTVTRPEDVDDELRHLVAVFSG